MSFELEYTVAWNRSRGRCSCSVFLPADGKPGVIVVTELADNPGPGVTNAIEWIAGHLENLLKLPLLDGYRLVEHYPAGTFLPVRYSLVELGHDGRRFHGPIWSNLTEEQLDRICGGADRPEQVLARWIPRREEVAADAEV